MKIRFQFEKADFSPEEESQWQDLLAQILGLYAKDLGLAQEFLNEIVIADEEKFDGAVSGLGDIRRFPFGDTHSSFASTVLQRRDNNVFCASLVFRRELIEHILSVVKAEKQEWAYDELFYKYIIYHELAHCLDFQKRFNNGSDKELESGNFSIRDLFNYFRSVFQSEFAASALASKAVGPGIFHELVNKACDDAFTRMNEMEGLKDDYDGKPERLFNLAIGVASGFWMILIRYGKLMGCKIGNEPIAKFRLKVWEKANPTSGVLLSNMGKHLWDIWQKYSEWNDEEWSFLLDIWHQLAEENGYKFVETPEGDGIYWK